jgi:hypothetical protein
MENIKTFEEFHNMNEAKKEYVKVNFGDKKETLNALDYITKYGQNFTVHREYGITKKKNGDVWFEVATTKQKSNLKTLISKNGGTILK